MRTIYCSMPISKPRSQNIRRHTMIVAPSFLTADLTRLESEIRSLSQAEWLHFDVMDGIFVPAVTYDHQMVAEVKKYSDQFFDCHLMVDNPLSDIYRYVKSGADLITVHLEALGPAMKVALSSIRDLGVKCGISIKPATAVESLEPYLDLVDLVLIMSVEPGKGGQKFMESALDKVAYLNRLRQSRQLSFLIEVDGGINLSTGKMIALAGADVAVAGSYIINQENRAKAIEELQHVSQT
jgi:ribulose-phosphate 3-epimerase